MITTIERYHSIVILVIFTSFCAILSFMNDDGMTEWGEMKGYILTKAKPLISKFISFLHHSVIPSQYLIHGIKPPNHKYCFPQFFHEFFSVNLVLLKWRLWKHCFKSKCILLEILAVQIASYSSQIPLWHVHLFFNFSLNLAYFDTKIPPNKKE